MALESKKDVHLDGSPVGPVSRLEVLEGPSAPKKMTGIVAYHGDHWITGYAEFLEDRAYP